MSNDGEEFYIESARKGFMDPLNIKPVTCEDRTCICCGKIFKAMPYEVADFCERCFVVVCKELFNDENDGMLISELKEKIKGRIDGMYNS